MVCPQTNFQDTYQRAPEAVTGSVQFSLRVQFFGRFKIIVDGKVLPSCPNEKAQTILRYMLARPKRPVSRDYLMGWLWPESSPERARSSLNSSIHILRRSLTESSTSATPTNYILFEEGYYRLTPNLRVSSDVVKFDSHYERGRHLEKSRKIPEAMVEYEKAVDLYKGDYLVEDLYEEWPMIERERLGWTHMKMLEWLAVYYAANEQYENCIRTCYQLLEGDSCYEPGHRLLIESYARLGWRSQALRHYQLCQRMMQRKLGLAPSPETKALCRELLRK